MWYCECERFPFSNVLNTPEGSGLSLQASFKADVSISEDTYLDVLYLCVLSIPKICNDLMCK